MSTRTRLESKGLAWLPVLLLSLPALGNAQVPVDSNGEPIGDYSAATDETATGNDDIPLLSTTELEDLVGPIALYPDDLLAIVLPASAYPLQIVQAGRFLEALEDDPGLKPDESWDDSVVALVNYPEVVKLLNDDLDWTWRLGEAVVAQQADVIAAVETFRDRAYAAGNLKSDDHQTVSRDEGYIEIVPVEDDVIYVPYYEPERVVVYQPRPVYYYYPRPYPVYYYPYPSGYAFNHGFFWGVTTAFTVGWHSDRLRVYHHSYYGHPYYGRTYWPRWWYRQPTINVYNNVYVNRYSNRSRDYHRAGDNWRPRDRRTVRVGDNRVTRTRYYPGRDGDATTRTRTDTRLDTRSRSNRGDRIAREQPRNAIKFRERPKLTSGSQNRETRESRNRQSGDRSSARREPTVREPARREIQRTPSRDTRVRQRNDVTSRQTQARRSDTRRSDAREPKQTQVRRSDTRRSDAREPKQTQIRRSDTRRSDARAPKQTQVRRSFAPRNEARSAPAQRSEPRRSEPQRSQRQASESKSGKSGSVKLAEGSRKERSKRRESRH